MIGGFMIQVKRENVLKMAHGAVENIVPPQETIDAVVKMLQPKTEEEANILILKLASNSMSVGYGASLESCSLVI
jgi:hypothetical protein